MEYVLKHQADDQKGHDLRKKHQHPVHAFHLYHPAGKQDGQSNSERGLGDGAYRSKYKGIFDKHSIIRTTLKNL